MTDDLDALQHEVGDRVEAVEQDIAEIVDRARNTHPVEAVADRWRSKRQQIVVGTAVVVTLLVLIGRRRRRQRSAG